MACCLFDAKSLSEPILAYCQFDHREHKSMKFYLKFESFHSRTRISKFRLQNGARFVSATMC